MHFENVPGEMEWPSIGTGHSEPFSMSLRPEKNLDFTVIIEFLDQRMLPGTQRFGVKKRGRVFDVGEFEAG